jgi:lipoprotein-releasing system permease protein
MFKLLLAWRYLRTRYIALASIVSVMLGVATLIVVNSVMAGFAHEMHTRLHGILSDIFFESYAVEGMPDPEAHMAEIKKLCGDDIAGMTATIQVPAMVMIPFNGKYVTKQINLIGIDEKTYAEVGDFSNFLLHPGNREKLAFHLREKGYDDRFEDGVGWPWRRERALAEQSFQEQSRQIEKMERERIKQLQGAGVEIVPKTEEPEESPQDPLQDTNPSTSDPEMERFDATKEHHVGCVLGIQMVSMRGRDSTGAVKDFYLARPGDDVIIALPNAGVPPKPIDAKFTVVDLYESKMSEYDATLAFVPLSKLQELRAMIDPRTGVKSVTSIQIKLREGANLEAVRDKLRDRFPPYEFPYQIRTWKDMQSPLLAAVQMETTLLNILLFLIIAVAGFGILATFFMIVVEKTRDIGILKSLGAPSRGVMNIFLSYGLSLGAVGSGVGTILGLLFVWNINRIAKLIELATGHEVFDPTVYYFSQIPTIVEPFTVCWVIIGSMAIAVAASVLPAIRAARLHPVEAFRHE